VFVGLVHSRPDPIPEPDPAPEPRRRRPDVPWRTLGVLAVIVALFAAADAVGGIVAYLLLLVAVTVGSLAIDRAAGYWGGLTEHRQ
jgi:hypothetical protein